MKDIQEYKKPFIRISSTLELVRIENLYKPEEIISLRQKDIQFEEFEVIYLHKWSGQ